MKLYIKQHVFTFRDRFNIFDEDGKTKYYVKGEILSIGKKLHVFDCNDREVAMIHQKVLSILPKFTIYVNEKEVAEIVKEISLFKARYSIEGLDWTIKGDYLDHNYEINQGRKTIVSIHKKWISFGDVYELDIEDKSSELYALMVVLAIDAVIAADKEKAAKEAENRE